MLNACLRCSTIFAGITSLIQAIIWAGISIWALAMHDCLAYFPYKSEVSHLFYVSYIRGACANTNFTYEAPSAKFTYNILMAYSIISSIWVPTAVMLLAGTCLGARGLKANWIYTPWLVTTLACCILDLYATIHYSIDISKTMTVNEFLGFLKIPEFARESLGLGNTRGLDGYVAIPAILMTILASRVIILWLVNLFLLAFGCQGICAFSKRTSPKKPAPYSESNQFKEDHLNGKHDNEIQWMPFSKPESLPKGSADISNTITALEPDGPLVLNPVEVQVKKEKMQLQYPEVEEVQMEETPQEINFSGATEHAGNNGSNVAGIQAKLHHLEELGLIVPIPKATVIEDSRYADPPFEEVAKSETISAPSEPASDAESVLEAVEDVLEGEAIDTPTPDNDEPRRVYDVDGKPTDERLTPKIARIQKIIERQMAAIQKGDVNGLNNAKPFSYTQPLMPQVDSVPKKKDTIRGLDKPPIPVPDYSVRVAKKTSFRTPLSNTDFQALD